MIGDWNAPPFLSKPCKAVLDKLQTACALVVAQQSVPGSLHLSHPTKYMSDMQHNKYINKIVEMNFSPLPKYKGKLDTTMSRSPAKKKKKQAITLKFKSWKEIYA